MRLPRGGAGRPEGVPLRLPRQKADLPVHDVVHEPAAEARRELNARGGEISIGLHTATQFRVAERGLHLILARPVHLEEGAACRDYRGVFSVSCQTSIAIAVASPPPMHRLAMPRLRPRALSAPMRVAMIRAPLAPIGCPSAVAPPCTLSFSSAMSSSRAAIIATAANASFTS